MKTIKILLPLYLFILGCHQAPPPKTSFSITINSEKVRKLTISKYDFELEKMVEFKTLTDLSTSEVYTITDQFTEPAIYDLKADNGPEMRIAVEQEGPVALSLDDEITMNSEVAINIDFNRSIEKLNSQFFADMIAAYDIAMKENDQPAIAKLEQQKDEVLVEFVLAMESLVREMGPSAQAYDALGYFDIYKNNTFLKEMAEKFEIQYPNSGMTSALQTRIKKAALVAIGSKAPNFKALNMQGATVDLSSFKGSYVLIDFWASWCRPCRVENPKLVSLLNEYRDVEFNIIGISIDSDVSLWQKAIEKDGLTWNQIRDADFSIKNLYLLSSLPSNFLLNKEGEIIAKNIKADQLKVQLDQFRAQR